MSNKIYKYECGGCDGKTRLILETFIEFDKNYAPTCVCGSSIPMFLYQVLSEE